MIHICNDDHGRQIMEAIDSQYTPVTMKVISRTEDDILQGGVVYENWTGAGGSCLVHMWGSTPRWINRDMMFVMFDYPFKQLDCNQAFCQVKGKNTHSIELNKKFGWEEVIRLEDVFPDDDMILMRMKRSACRYLNVRPSNKEIKSRKVVEHG